MPHTLTITQAAERIRSGRLSPVELLDACFSQIEALDGSLHAWVLVDREGAGQSARCLQEELARGRYRGPLHGIPVGIKDIIDVKGMPTAAGARHLYNRVPDKDAAVVARLRSSGAVIPGKTVTTPFACFDPAETRNPWNPDHTPGGSSSGSAAAVAARMCPASLGSQTGGSISRPAAYCGLVGLKPTFGRISLRGILPVSYELDHPGPFTRSVADAAVMLQCLAGRDPLDPLSADVPVDTYRIEPPARAPRVGVIRTYFPENAGETMREATGDAIERLASAGAEFTDVHLPGSFADLHENHALLLAVGAANVHGERYGAHRDAFPPGLREIIERGRTTGAVAYARARRHQIAFKSEVLAAFENVDLLLTPATPTPAPSGLTSTGNPAFNSPWSYAGLPTSVLPAACASDGLPAGIQLVARPFAESQLLSISAWCEAHLEWDRAPSILSGD
ncbi:MAG: amidase [Gemmatimonadota bacterium]|nr:amidase [Gemmatimonadota bacterium]